MAQLPEGPAAQLGTTVLVSRFFFYQWKPLALPKGQFQVTENYRNLKNLLLALV